MLKMDYERAEKIRAEYEKGGVTHSMLAQKYGVHENTIWNILNYKTFKHGNRGSYKMAVKVRQEYFSNTEITQRELAEKYNVTINIISDIVNNKTHIRDFNEV